MKNEQINKFFDEVKKTTSYGINNTPEGQWPQMNDGKITSVESNTPNNKQTPGTANNTPHNHTHIKINNMNQENCVKNRKVLSKQLIIASGTAAGTYEKEADFGLEYKRCVGYYIINASLGGLTVAQIEAGISDGTRTILDLTPIEHHNATTTVPIKDRFNREECMELPSGKLIFPVKITAATSSELKLVVLAILERQ